MSRKLGPVTACRISCGPVAVTAMPVSEVEPLQMLLTSCETKEFSFKKSQKAALLASQDVRPFIFCLGIEDHLYRKDG